MLSNNVVSFMKKMVKTGEQPQNQPGTADKLSRLKQTLTTGLLQAHESVVKFSPKVINVDVTARRPSGIEEAATPLVSELIEAAPSILTTTPACNKTQCPAGPPNRLTSCRVCVRTLTGSHADVSYRICSQCNLKVCEDCASYSNVDNFVDQTFWRCSVCRRRSASVAAPITASSASSSSSNTGGGSSTPTATASTTSSSTTPSGSGTSSSGGRPAPSAVLTQRWSEEKLGSFSNSAPEDYTKRSGAAVPPGSAPTSRRRGTSAVLDVNEGRGNHRAFPGLQDQGSSRPGGYGHSAEDVRNTSIIAVNGGRNSRTEQQQQQQQETTTTTSSSSSSRGGEHSSRRSFQQHAKESSLYLSADDACGGPAGSRRPSRRLSSESSEDNRRSQDVDGEGSSGVSPTSPTSPTAPVSPSTSRRRMSFRSSRNRLGLYDGDGSDGYDADEQSGTYDSSSSPVETSHPSSTYHMSVDLPARSMLPRRSCSDIPVSIQQQLDPSPQQQQQPSRSPRPSISSRSGSGSQQGSERRSIERAAISIIIDDVDSSIGSSAPPAAAPVAVNNSYVVQLHRDHSRGGGSFTSGFGLNLSGRYSGAVIARIEPHGPADRAGLRVGDVILSWDGVQLSGRSLEQVQDELQHSGDSIQIEVERTSSCHQQSSDREVAEILNSSSSSNGPVVTRPNKLASNLMAALEGGGGNSGGGRATPPSPTRRRLPQAPVAGLDLPGGSSQQQPTHFYRVQLKLKSSMDGRTGQSSLVIAVIGAEKSTETGSTEGTFGWLTLILILPNGAGSRMFTTDRIETAYGQVRWNAVFTCQDLTAEEAAGSHLCLSLWEDSFQRGEIKLAEAKVDLERVALDGRSVSLTLRPSGSDLVYSSNPSPNVSRRPSRAGPAYQLQQQNIYINSRNSSIDQPNSPPSSSASTPPGMSRSRSAELAAHLLLQPEMPGWASSGLSAPASLAPSRRGSNFNCEDEGVRASPIQQALMIPRGSAPTSRRGSAVLPSLPPQAVEQLANMQLAVQEKLTGAGSRRSSQVQISHQHIQQLQQHSERVINTSSLELGAGQILPHGMLMSRGEAATHSVISSSTGQIKLGLILTQGQLEVEVIAARHLPLVGESCNIQPDTFVQVSLCDQDRVFSKRKTKTMRQTCHPQFHQTLLFEACNALGATLVIDVRLKDPGSYRSSGGRKMSYYQQQQDSLGLVHIRLDRLPLTTLTMAWYRLVPAHLIDLNDQYHSDDSS